MKKRQAIPLSSLFAFPLLGSAQESLPNAPSPRVSRLEKRRSRDAFASAAQRSEKPSAVDQCSRQFKHSLNGNGGIKSLCLRCGVVVASVDDEWYLLEHERRHVCSHAH
jgi:hypothetical protein